MFSLTSMPSTASVLSTYTTFAASAMLVRTVLNEVQNMTSQLVPNQLQAKILAGVGDFFGYSSSQMTLIIEEYNGFSINQIYESSETYLRTKVTPSVEKLIVSKSPREKKISVTINKGEKVVDVFGGIQLKWQMICTVSKQTSEGDTNESRSIELSFHKKYMEKVLNFYLPHVMNTSKAIKEENKVVKLYSLGGSFGGEYGGGVWGSTNLDHPSTFDTLAIDPVLKKELIDDLEKFVKRKNFYRRVGKAWKRGYLLYGPPGTGKSSLIAAMANYLKFNIYDLELTSLQNNSDLRRLLVSTTNKSILVIEDIDCSIELQDRQSGGHNQGDGQVRLQSGRHNQGDGQLTLSGLLNFIDGLWSSCGDERIIVFTTNHKERLDPALLRPGRMDMHIHMSYCTPSGFRILASNYLGVKNHCLFTEIEGLIMEVEVTPAEIAEELMKNEDANISLQGLINSLQTKKMERCKSNEVQEDNEKGNENQESKKQATNKRKAITEKTGEINGGTRKSGNKRTKRGRRA